MPTPETWNLVPVTPETWVAAGSDFPGNDTIPDGNDTIPDEGGNDTVPDNGEGPLDDVPLAGYIVWGGDFLGGEVPEATPVGTTLAQVSAAPGLTNVFSLVQDEDNKFAVTPEGVLTLADALDYTADPDHPFTLRATNIDNRTLDFTGRVTVLDRAPEAIDLTWEAGFSGGLIPEATSVGTKIASLRAYPGQSLVFSLTDPDGKLSLVDNGDGTADLELDGALDPGDPAHSFTVSVSNAQGSAPDLDEAIIVGATDDVLGVSFINFRVPFAAAPGTIAFKVIPTYGATTPAPVFTLASFQRRDVVAGTVAGNYA